MTPLELRIVEKAIEIRLKANDNSGNLVAILKDYPKLTIEEKTGIIEKYKSGELG